VTWRIEVGDCRDVLRSLPAGSVHSVVTSPPYFGLRDYDTEGQIGLEPTPDEFVTALVAVFREVRRVLRDDGTVWLNLGDSYSTQPKGNPGALSAGLTNGGRNTAMANAHRGGVDTSRLPGVKPKDLLGIPWMVAFALRADGWCLRSDIIWSKPNPMPESVTDRPTKAHEYVFLLSKGPRYFYDADAIREPPSPTSAGNRRAFRGEGDYTQGRSFDNGAAATGNAVAGNDGEPTARNKRSVWTVATQPYAGAHFATFPPKLIEPCVLAGAPERACGECGAPWVRVVERTPMVVRPTPKREAWQAEDDHARTQTGGTMLEPPSSRTLGFEPSCPHGDGSAAGVVLDPFAGAGTTGLVALQHGREFVGIELSPAYAQMARERIETAVRLGFRAPQKVAAPNGQGSLFD
jgi:DNA modification methylase